MAKPLLSLPRDLKTACKRFEAWRRTRVGRSRIPAELWDLAVSLAERHGNSRVSKTLRLSYRDLQRHVARTKPMVPPPDSSFLELDLGRSFPLPESVIELQDPKGSKITIRLPGSNSLDVIALSNAFFGSVR